MLRNHFEIKSIRVSYTRSVARMGHLSPQKAIIIVKVFFSLLRNLFCFKPSFVYFPISPLGAAFFRDLVFVSTLKLFNVKILYHLHGKGIKQDTKKTWIKFFYRFAFNSEDVICLSHLLSYDIENVFNGQIYIVNNGIPDINKEQISALLGEKTNTPRVLYLSNLLKSKGVVDFLNALEILHIKGVKLIGEIVGAEGDISERELRQMIHQKKLSDKVFYLGPKYNKEKQGVYKKTNVFVFPTRLKHECFPTVLLEAMQNNLPIISTNEGAIPDIVDNGKTGFLIEKNAPEQIAEKIEVLIKNFELQKKMGEAGRKKYEERYMLQHFEDNMKNVFEQVLSNIHSGN